MTWSKADAIYKACSISGRSTIRSAIVLFCTPTQRCRQMFHRPSEPAEAAVQSRFLIRGSFLDRQIQIRGSKLQVSPVVSQPMMADTCGWGDPKEASSRSRMETSYISMAYFRARPRNGIITPASSFVAGGWRRLLPRRVCAAHPSSASAVADSARRSWAGLPRSVAARPPLR